MGVLVWVMMGLAIWHFTVFLPDRFWGGIVGAFLGALFGAVIVGLAVNGFDVPGKDDTTIASAFEAIPGALVGIAAVYFLGVAAATRPRPSRVARAAGAGLDRGLERVAGRVDLVDDQAEVGGVAKLLPCALRARAGG